jgi:hypothetical protein
MCGACFYHACVLSTLLHRKSSDRRSLCRPPDSPRAAGAGLFPPEGFFDGGTAQYNPERANFPFPRAGTDSLKTLRSDGKAGGSQARLKGNTEECTENTLARRRFASRTQGMTTLSAVHPTEKALNFHVCSNLHYTPAGFELYICFCAGLLTGY